MTAVVPDDDKAFTVVTKKKAKNGPQPLKPLYDPNDQKVIVQPHTQTSVQMTWQYLRMANRAVWEYQKELDYCFIRCHVTIKQILPRPKDPTISHTSTPLKGGSKKKGNCR